MATEKKTFNKFLSFFILSLVIFSSCKQPQADKTGVHIPVPKDTSALARIDHFIPVEDIERFKKEFSVERDSLSRSNPKLFIPISETFNKQALINLLKDSTNVGVRIYYGVKTGRGRNELRLILVGVNSQGKDLFFQRGGDATQIGAKLPPPLGFGGDEYGQCTPPCSGIDQ